MRFILQLSVSIVTAVGFTGLPLLSLFQLEIYSSPLGRLNLAQYIARIIEVFPESVSPVIILIHGWNDNEVFLCDWKFCITSDLIKFSPYRVRFRL